MPLPANHPLIKRAIELAADADEDGHQIFATALVALCRATTWGLPAAVSRGLVNASIMMLDTVTAHTPRKEATYDSPR